MTVRLVDASVFLGMHATGDELRRTCKGFFVDALAHPGGVTMSLEEVGRCDDLVWARPRAVQDAYYPFMDALHSTACILRIGFARDDLAAAVSAAEDDRPPGLADAERLQVALAARIGARLVSVRPGLAGRADRPADAPEAPAGEPVFPPPLEALYQRSLALRIPVEEVLGVRFREAAP